jgi:broad specificity phosphatase PhoE
MTRKIVVLGIALAVLSVCLPHPVYAQRLVFIVRHAERADAAAPQMQGQADPPLSSAGEARAKKLAGMLADTGIKAIFVTEYRRTQDTAGPLAAKLGLNAERVPARDTQALIAKLQSEHAGDIVFIVGHSNTVPDVIKSLGGPDVKIADDEYDNLFIVVPATGTMTRLRFTP